MNEKTYRVLEYNKIIELLQAEADGGDFGFGTGIKIGRNRNT